MGSLKQLTVIANMLRSRKEEILRTIENLKLLERDLLGI